MTSIHSNEARPVLFRSFALMAAITFHATAAGAENLDCAAHRQDELTCLACNIYHEAANQPELGQMAVAMVTLNRLRTRDFPKTICEIVWEKGRDYRTGRTVAQFAWTLDDRPDVVTSEAAWAKARSIAARAMVMTSTSDAPMHDPSAGALFFHADYVTPYWSSDPSLRLVNKIGNHLFYERSNGTPAHTLASLLRATPVPLQSPLQSPASSSVSSPDGETLHHPASGAVRRGAKLISLSGAVRGGMIEAKIYEGTRSRVMLVRREGP